MNPCTSKEKAFLKTKKKSKKEVSGLKIITT